MRVIGFDVLNEASGTRIRVSLIHTQGSPLFSQIIRFYGSSVGLYTMRITLLRLLSSMIREELRETPTEIRDDGLAKNISYDIDWYGLDFTNRFSATASKPGTRRERRLVRANYELSSPYSDMRISFEREEQTDGYEREEEKGVLELPHLMLPHIP